MGLFQKVREYVKLVVCHAGEKGPPEYIWQALFHLRTGKIDHGVRCSEDEYLLKYVSENRIPLTVCPLSNIKLRVFDSLSDSNLKSLMNMGLCITINSDESSLFGGYLLDNYTQTQKALNLSAKYMADIARNSFKSLFIHLEEKLLNISKIDSLEK